MTRERKHGRAARWPRLGAAATLALTGGCAGMDPAYNPIEWATGAYRGVTGTFSDAPAPDRPRSVEPPPAEGRPYPNLASVPRPPPRPDLSRRDADMNRLAGDRSAAVAFDTMVRTQVPAAEPPAPVALPPAESPRRLPATPDVAPPRAAPPTLPSTVPPPPTQLLQQASRATPPPVEAADRADLRVVTVVFPEGSPRLTDGLRLQVRGAAESALARDARVRVRPYAPSEGAEARRLAEARGEAVARELVRLGVAGAKVTVAPVGLGPGGPGLAANRRVEILVDY